MPWRVLGTQSRGVLRLAQFSRPSLCMPVDLIVFLILAYDFDLLSFSSWDVPKMCQGTHSLTNSLIHSNGRSDKTGDSSVIRHWTWNHTEKTTYGTMDWILPASWDLQSSSLRWRKHAIQPHDDRQPNFAMRTVKFGFRSSWRWIACFLQRSDELRRSAAAACFVSCLDLQEFFVILVSVQIPKYLPRTASKTSKRRLHFECSPSLWILESWGHLDYDRHVHHPDLVENVRIDLTLPISLTYPKDVVNLFTMYFCQDWFKVYASAELHTSVP